MKTWKKLLALLMALAMVFAMAACGNDSKVEKEDKEEKKEETTAPVESGDKAEDGKEEAKEENKEEDKKEEEEVTEPEEKEIDLEGEWLAQLDMSESINEQMAETTGGMISIDDEPIYMNVEMDIDEDGKFKLVACLDETSFKKYMTAMIDAMCEYAIQMGEAQGMTLEDLEEQMGMTIEEFKEMMSEQIDELMEDSMVAALEGLTKEGYCVLDGNKLYMADEVDELEDEEVYFEISKEGDVLILEALIGADLEDILGDLEDMNIEPENIEFPWVFERQ